MVCMATFGSDDTRRRPETEPIEPAESTALYACDRPHAIVALMTAHTQSSLSDDE